MRRAWAGVQLRWVAGRILRMAQERIPLRQVQDAILVIRGQKVLLDRDLASLYGVETRTLNQAVQRNVDRFPGDFMFQLTADEASDLRSQFVISSQGPDKNTARNTHGGRRSLPFVFTEQGVAMLSSVLRSPRAVQVNISIKRAFVQLRELMSTHKDIEPNPVGVPQHARGAPMRFRTNVVTVPGVRRDHGDPRLCCQTPLGSRIAGIGRKTNPKSHAQSPPFGPSPTDTVWKPRAINRLRNDTRAQLSQTGAATCGLL